MEKRGQEKLNNLSKVTQKVAESEFECRDSDA